MLITFINPRLPLSQSHAAIVIGRLMGAVARTNGPAYRVFLDVPGDEQVKPTPLSSLFDCVPQIDEAYADHCDDEHQDVFWMAYRGIGSNAPRRGWSHEQYGNRLSKHRSIDECAGR
jgi:hypothetical protein